ncbi:MAG TPA: hypothetical protein PKY59_14115 [Pyrinomonadaceae bacterium]|nr:hypothetical protein [Pyrinomonadaceae bacterium]
MSNWNLSFSELLVYPDNLQGINIEIILSLGTNLPIAAEVKLDTGSTFCIFQRHYGELLGLDIESGDPEIIRTATGKFIAYGHEITLTVADLEWTATVYFAKDENFPVSVVGRVGFLDRLKIGLVDYQQTLYLSSLNE